jgi:hypothetical protein
MVDPVELIHVPDHSYVKGPKGARGCKAMRSDGIPCNKAHFHPLHNLPTLNETLTHEWAVYQGALKHWKLWLNDALIDSGLPKGLDYVLVAMRCTFPDRNRRDQGNMRGFIEKALGDTLASKSCARCKSVDNKKGRCLSCGSVDLLAGWIPDDKFFPTNHYEFNDCEAVLEPGSRRTHLMIFPRVDAKDPSADDVLEQTLW